MKRITPYIIVNIVFLFYVSLSFSQVVSVKATINRDKIMIGEAIELIVEAKVPIGNNIEWFYTDSLPHFDFIDKGKIDTVVTTDYKTYTQHLTITSFDSGRWAVAALPLVVGRKKYYTDSLPVSVAYSNFDKNQDYHDIKDIIEVEKPNTGYINWVLGALSVIALLAIIYFLRKKKVAPTEVVNKSTSKLSPLQEALQTLEQLKKQGYADADTVKTYHTGLSDTLRWYLYRKTNIATMEKTSGELMLQLKDSRLNNNDFIQLAQVLRMNDAVKFAKYQPTAQENEQAIDSVKKSIEQLDKTISS